MIGRVEPYKPRRNSSVRRLSAVDTGPKQIMPRFPIGKRRHRSLLKILPDWYPLPLYLKDLSPEMWVGALMTRFLAYTMYRTVGEPKSGPGCFNAFILADLEEYIATRLIRNGAKLWGTPAVRDLSTLAAAFIADVTQRSRQGRHLLKEIRSTRRSRSLRRRLFLEEVPESFGKTHREAFAKHAACDRVWRGYAMRYPAATPVLVDLNQDDQWLIASFSSWLAAARAKRGYFPRSICARDFAEWRTYGVLPAFDLMFWAEVHGFRYSERVVADTLWPDAQFDGAERLRKVTWPRVKETILCENPAAARLWRQLLRERVGGVSKRKESYSRPCDSERKAGRRDAPS
jgi:hypothetical protein